MALEEISASIQSLANMAVQLRMMLEKFKV